MSVKKIEFDGKTLIDLTKDTVTAGSMLSGVKAHNNEGDIITGNIPTKTAANLTANGKTVTVPAGYYSTQATKDVATATRAKTTMSSSAATDNSKITITASNNQGTGYVTGSNETASKDVSLTVNGAQITVSDGTSTINQTVPSVARANTTMTSTKSTDNKKITITASNDQKTGYVAGANKTASRDVTLSISGKTATASDGNVSISQNVADGAILATNGSISADGTTYTQAKINASAGYITAGEKIGGATFANTATEGKTYKNISGTTAAPILVSGSSLFINKGYTDDVEISLARLVPNGASPVQSIKNGMLTSVSAYDSDGTLVTGNIISRGAADVTVSGKSITTKAGYYSTDVKKSVTDGVLSANDSSITGGSFTPTVTYNNTSGKFDFGGNKTVSGTAHAKATTAGYVDSTKNTSKSLSATVSATGSLNKVGTGASISGTTTVKPVISRTAKPTADTWTDAASGAAVTTKPTSGPYVQVNSAAKTGTLTATPKVTSAGYGTETAGQYTATNATASVGAQASDTTYVPIKAGSLTKTQGTASASVTKNPTATASVSQTGMNDGISETATSYYVTGSASSASGVASASVTTSKVVATEGYVFASTVATDPKSASTTEKTASDNKTVYLKAAGISVSGGALSKGTASGGGLSGGDLTAGSGSCSLNSSANVTLSDTDNGIYVKFAGSGSVSRGAITRAAFSQSVSRAAINDTRTAGYLPARTSTKVMDAASTTVSLGEGSIAAASKSSNTGYATKYITGVTVPVSKTFTVSNSGTTTVTTSSASAGTTAINAYNNASTPALTGAKNVTSGGKWVITDVNSATADGTHYGMVNHKKTTYSGLDASKMLTTATVKIGDSGSATRIANVTGTIPTKTESDVTVSEAVLTVPAGYYATNITKDVAAGTAKAPTSITGSSATLTAGTNTITLKKTVSVTPVVTPGYITTGTATDSAVSLTASVTTKGAATYNTATSDQTIAAGQYLTGAQTIKAVTTSNITAANILKGVVVKVGDANNAGRIKNVTGTADYVKTVSSVPTTKDTSIIYNSANGKYYIWK